MFIQNYAFLLFIVAAIYAAGFNWLKTPVELLTAATAMRILLYIGLALATFTAVYVVNLGLIFLFGRRELFLRTEARWRELLLAAIDHRPPSHKYSDLVDHAAGIQIVFDRMAYALKLWEI